MLKKSNFNKVIVCCLAILLSSCASKENLLYFQDIKGNLPKESLAYTNIVQKDDLLQIRVMSEDMTSVALFNQNSFINNEGNAVINPQQIEPGYIVDANGEIFFLSLGRIKVSGLTLLEVRELLTEKLKKYVNDPIVDVRISNFKVTIIGEVARPGTFNISENRISLPQALGLAGDLTIFGNRKEILLLRDDNGIQKSIVIDLTSSSFVNSEAYFLKQNDVLVIAPNETRVQASKFNQNASLYVGIASLILTATVLILNQTR